MRPLLFLLFAVNSFVACATNYYFSQIGNDGNTGTSINAAWQTISRFNSTFKAFKPGDSILFHRGDVFYGSMIISRSGTFNAPITIGAYGKGAKPVITGFKTVTAWGNLGSNIWESTSTVSKLATCNMMSINGINTAMGRFPNYPNYFNWVSHSNDTLITTTNLTGTTDWTGATITIFATTYRPQNRKITFDSDNKIIHFTKGSNLWQNAPGYFFQQFFIENDVRTLDKLNEWYYNPTTRKLDIYSFAAPTGVMVATVDTLIWTNNKSFITIRDLELTGANEDAISIAASNDIKIVNCHIGYIGGTAIYGNTYGTYRKGIRIDSNTIEQVNNCGIDLKYWYVGDTIRGNTIRNINMLIGMQNVEHTIGGGVVGIGSESDRAVISYNHIDSVGISGISYKGSNVSVDHNFVTNTCLGNGIRDLGAIYTWNGLYKTSGGTKVFNNIILNTGPYSEGIYCDEGSTGIEIYNNTCYNVLRGIYLSDVSNIYVHDNTTFNTGAAGVGAGLFMNNNPGAPKLRYITLKNNKFIAKKPIDRSLWVITTDSPSMPKPFISDSNYFAKPLGFDVVNNIQTLMTGAHYVQRTLSDWQVLNGQDAHSRGSPKQVTNMSDFNFQYNATSLPVTISLPHRYIDITGAVYDGSVTLLPYSSWVGIRDTNK